MVLHAGLDSHLHQLLVCELFFGNSNWHLHVGFSPRLLQHLSHYLFIKVLLLIIRSYRLVNTHVNVDHLSLIRRLLCHHL